MPSFDRDYYASLVRSSLGRDVRYFEETTSTMDEARAGADAHGHASRGVAYRRGTADGRTGPAGPAVGI